MKPDLETAIDLLARTPVVLRSLLEDLDEDWTRANEGPETWSPFDVIGHLIHGELTDWIPRLRMILEHGKERTFEPFDRFAQFEASRGKTLEDLLDEFAELRAANLDALQELELGPSDFDREGLHPELGVVTLGQLLATWMAHDLGHLAQIGRVLAQRYRDDVGPWREYMPVLGRKR